MAVSLKFPQTTYATNNYSALAFHPHIPSFSGVFRGRELTPKQRRLASGLLPLDHLLDGGIVRGRISEIIGADGTGKTSLAAAFMAQATNRGEIGAWIDSSGGFDPASIAAAGVVLPRVLWVAAANKRATGSFSGSVATYHDYVDDQINYSRQTALKKKYRPPPEAMVKAVEWLLVAGGFGLIVLDFKQAPALSQAVALRLARAAERSGTAVLVTATRRMCGTFAALSLTLRCHRACFSRTHLKAPILFDGLELEACVARNKLGGSGGTVTWKPLTYLDGFTDFAPDSVAAPATRARAH
ncbi:MAG: ATPase domain-containing protein, partial [Terriglobia bacterium]